MVIPMVQISTLTQKGQVTIPVSIRRRWGLKPQQRITFVKKGDSVEIRPMVDFFALRGSVKTRKKYSDQKADQALRKYFAKDRDH